MKIKRLHFRNLPIAAKLYAGFLFVFVIMIALSWLTYSNFRKDKEKDTLEVIRRLNTQTVSKIDENMDGLTAMSKVPLIWEQGEHSALFSYVDESNSTGRFDIQMRSAFTGEANKYMTVNDNIESLALFNRRGIGLLYIDGKWSSVSIQDSAVREAFDAALQDYKQVVKMPTYPVANSTHPSKPYYVFGVARGIYKLETSETIGVVMVAGSVEDLLKLAEEMRSVEGNRVFLLDDHNRILADRDPSQIGQPAREEIRSKLDAHPGDPSNRITLDGTDYLFSYAVSERTGWKVVNLIPLKALYKNMNHMAMTTFLTTLSLLLLMIVFTVLFSRSIVKPVHKLIRLMKRVEDGEFNKEIILQQEDEIGQLARTFNQMSGRIEHLIHEVSREKISQKEMELQMLKMQINPHFLYNTLESIRMVAESRQAPDAADMAFSLGEILRYGINRTGDLVTVREEIYHLEQYMLLQKIRFEDVFSIELDIRPEIMELRMLKVVLQPLVENAILHGITNRSSGGLVEVRGYSDGDNLIFEVCDNGRGMPEAQSAALNRSFRHPEEGAVSIGLHNVNKRIQLFYGEAYGLEIISTPEVGTNIFVCIPIKEEEAGVLLPAHL
ncbi:putative HAMP domain-containing sensor [Paenibacillus mucilaginosus 3016]|uniref:Putative HAMP domain-containing sensor n=1 Tax=Paenibacillus mucilaginosus 3016 TaxID=1116391 RepID=H6NCE9_9BACL|nr:sensor histidine kinase [Paenibacillus mucilaginosus]AFC28562.1 putative HAMP domain-containing sensor [Paenibacillus mucilaginosus 3016]WFA17348.1 sensor histidine kinase [Paenibacillus mucilaginosus]